MVSLVPVCLRLIAAASVAPLAKSPPTWRRPRAVLVPMPTLPELLTVSASVLLVKTAKSLMLAPPWAIRGPHPVRAGNCKYAADAVVPISTLPSNLDPQTTCKEEVGLLVPIPTYPELLIRAASPFAFSIITLDDPVAVFLPVTRAMSCSP